MISVGSDKDNHIIINDKENINNYYCQMMIKLKKDGSSLNSTRNLNKQDPQLAL